jgi:hypothetical protein
MKKTMSALGLVCLIVAAAFASGAALPNYSGTWVMNKEKSKDLPPFMASMDSYEMVVSQNDKLLSIKTTAAGAQEVSYNLDGSKGKAQMAGRMPGEATVYLEKKDDGKVVLHAERELNFQGNAVTINITETWELLDAGKTLSVSRTIDSPRGTQSMTLVFGHKA